MYVYAYLVWIVGTVPETVLPKSVTPELIGSFPLALPSLFLGLPVPRIDNAVVLLLQLFLE